MDLRKIYILIISAVAVNSAELYAQPNSLGIVFSLNSAGLSYEHSDNDDSTTELSLNARFDDILNGCQSISGYDASVVWNIKIGESVTSEDNTVRFIAGPGAIVGWGDDYNDVSGLYFGLKGRLGAECSYLNRRITISAYISPVLGGHVTKSGKTAELDLYDNGLIYALIPEIAIKYRF
jgi:hypothetical protein